MRRRNTLNPIVKNSLEIVCLWKVLIEKWKPSFFKLLKYTARVIQEKYKKIFFPFWEHFVSLLKIKPLRVIAKKVLRDFWEIHADCEQQLKSWFQEASNAQWKNPNEIKLDFPSASILNDNRVVFNIKGNHYRLIVKLNYDYQMIWIRFIGTHAAYDKIKADEI